MVKIWLGVFWGGDVEAERAEGATVPVPASHRLMSSATTLAVAGTVAIAVFAGPLWDASVAAAEDLVDADIYIQEVLG